MMMVIQLLMVGTCWYNIRAFNRWLVMVDEQSMYTCATNIPAVYLLFHPIYCLFQRSFYGEPPANHQHKTQHPNLGHPDVCQRLRAIDYGGVAMASSDDSHMEDQTQIIHRRGHSSACSNIGYAAGPRNCKRAGCIVHPVAVRQGFCQSSRSVLSLSNVSR